MPFTHFCVRLGIPSRFSILVCLVVGMVGCSSTEKHVQPPTKIKLDTNRVLGPYAPDPDPHELPWKCMGFQGYEVAGHGLDKVEAAFAEARNGPGEDAEALVPPEALLVEDAAQAKEIGFTCELDWSSQKLLVVRMPQNMTESIRLHSDLEIDGGQATAHVKYEEVCPPGRAPVELMHPMAAFYQLRPVPADVRKATVKQHPTIEMPPNTICANG